MAILRLSQLPARVGRLALLTALVAAGSGCYTVNKTNFAVPASRIDNYLFAEARDGQVPVPLQALGQVKPEDHRIGAGDTLSVYVYGVLPPDVDQTLVLPRTQAVNQIYYPPNGSVVGPTTGVPVVVSGDGTIDLPLIDGLNVRGMTLREARTAIKAAYAELEVVKEGRERVTVQLITPRTVRVTILREDTPNEAVALTNPQVVDQIHRGSGEVIDLPVYENDILHALTATGGLPGTDGQKEVWVFRQGAGVVPASFTAPVAGNIIASHHAAGCGDGAVVRIPLSGPEGCPVPFGAEDVVLNEGDVLYVPRRQEYFMAGGLLPGARIPLPRDEDIDVIEAIALATGTTGGPLGLSGQALAGGSPGWFAKAKRVLVLRKLPDGRQVPIRVDLGRALRDPKERLIIQNGDLVILEHTPAAAALNVFANWLNVSFIFNGTQN